jgi:hypothetical protein
MTDVAPSTRGAHASGRRPKAPSGAAFQHTALFYRDEGEYLRGTVPFILAGHEAGEPVAVAVPGARLGTLREGPGR